LAVEEIFLSAYFCQTALYFFIDALEIYLAAWGLHLLGCEYEMVDDVATDVDAVLRP
jgi:hypothetical protein